MPCCDPYPDWTPPRSCRTSHTKTSEDYEKTISSLKSELSKLGKQYHELKGRADKLTQFLCYTCGLIREAGLSYDSRLADWIKEHDEWDEKRTFEAFKKQYPTGDVHWEEALDWFIMSAQAVHPLSNWHRTVFFDKIWQKYQKWITLKDNTERLKKEKLEQIAKLQAELKELDETVKI